MIEIKCPRCEQYWYDNDEEGGRVRLCSRCLDHLHYKRRQRGLIDLPFLLVAGILLVIDLFLIALTVVRPELFAKMLLIYGFVQLAGGMIVLTAFGFQSESGLDQWLASEWFSQYELNTNWNFGRWFLLIATSGIACSLAAGAFLRFK